MASAAFWRRAQQLALPVHTRSTAVSVEVATSTGAREQQDGPANRGPAMGTLRPVRCHGEVHLVRPGRAIHAADPDRDVRERHPAAAAMLGELLQRHHAPCTAATPNIKPMLPQAGRKTGQRERAVKKWNGWHMPERKGNVGPESRVVIATRGRPVVKAASVSSAVG